MTNDLLARRDAWLADYRPMPRRGEQGAVVSVGDGIAWVRGLPSAAIDDLLQFADGSRAQVFHLRPELLGAVLLEQTPQLAAGTRASHAGLRLSVPVGDALLGRVIDPLGEPLDGQAPPPGQIRGDLDAGSPAIIERDFVNRPLYTGTRVVDTLIPIGRGQRQLLIGDNGLGKTALAVDAVVNQRDQDVLCIYVTIGQKRSDVVNLIEILRDQDALRHTVVVVAEATALPGLKYLAPFAGCALAEHWMRQGRDTLVIYDDLTAHARTYRELSLLLRRPPGREAYPGDIFHLHARLLERATCLSAGNGGGSMTALPIVETEQGEIAAYVPTNLISITDGQVYFDRDLFASGMLPAVDVAHSVSRIGGNAQHPRVKQEAGRVKFDYLQFLELEVFTRFGTRLEEGMAARLKRGRVLRELLKQERLAPLPIRGQLGALLAFNQGYLDDVAPSDIAPLLERLAAAVKDSGLRLDDPREHWTKTLRSVLTIQEDGRESPPQA